ncbi:MAG: caspase family protein [Gemmatimonadales bacterium]
MKRHASLAALLALPLLAFGPQERTAATHWALLVGISDYINFDDVEGGDLPGAEQDARRIRDVLVMKGYVPDSNIRLLLNREATRAAIEESITGWLAERARPGDNVTIFFAGHGSQMWDESGDEDDGLDETLAPADVMATSTENDISDDTFNAWLGALPTDNVVVILDNCNSGTGTRDVTPFSRGRLLARDMNQVPRPTAARRALGGQQDDTGFDPGEIRVLELAAAQPYQVAVDAYFPATEGTEAFHGGAFTTFLVQQLWKAGSDVSYEEVFRGAHEALKRNRFEQDPYLSTEVALKDRPLFFVEGGARGESQVALPVTTVSGGRVQLGAGLGLGITPGSVFQTASGARLIVESVGQRSADARIASGEVRPGEDARLVAHRYADSPLLVNVAGIESRLIESLRTGLAGATGVRPVEREDAFAHLIVRRGGDELRVVGSDGFVRHAGIGIDASGISRLADILRKEAASKRLADMDNPAQAFGVRLELVEGKTSFGVGEEIGFTVESERDGFLTLVDLGTDGTVAVLLPNAETRSVPVRAGRAITYPEPGGALSFAALEPTGTGLVRAFVTERPLDIAIPAGEDYAFGGEELAQRIGSALSSAAGALEGAVLLDTWGTASVVYEIHD